MAVADHLPADVAASAAAIANARAGRRGAPPVTNVLDMLSERLLAEVVADARAVLAALAALPPRPRVSGPLRGTDAAALGLDVGANFAVVAVSVDGEQSDVAFWARGIGSSTLSARESAHVVAALSDLLSDLPNPSQPTETNP